MVQGDVLLDGLGRASLPISLDSSKTPSSTRDSYSPFHELPQLRFLDSASSYPDGPEEVLVEVQQVCQKTYEPFEYEGTIYSSGYLEAASKIVKGERNKRVNHRSR